MRDEELSQGRNKLRLQRLPYSPYMPHPPSILDYSACRLRVRQGDPQPLLQGFDHFLCRLCTKVLNL